MDFPELSLGPIRPLLPLALYAFVASVTPGPNNLLLASSGIRFGFMRTIPHMVGIVFGFFSLLLASGFGIATAVLAIPGAELSLKVVGSGYLLYLAWVVRRSVVHAGEQRARPFSFWQAALFQYVNPKGWLMAVSGAAAFMPSMSSQWKSALIYAGVFCVVGIPCIMLWALLGSSIRHWLGNQRVNTTFSAVMVVLVIYSAVAIWL